MKTRVGVVLAVYNGEDFLRQQLESIVLQSYQDWSLYVRDDCSNDDSQAIVKHLSKVDERVHLLTDVKGNMGVCGNFSSLAEAEELVSYPYLAFSDQDDVWQFDKLRAQLDAMRKMEAEFPETALLVHSDMEVVDTFLKMIAPSFMSYQGIHHEDKPLAVLLVQNFVTGCTVLVNRKLLDIALPIPKEALMHDWWLALCAASCGRVEYIDRPLVKYRQHGFNEVGAKSIRGFLNPFRTNWWKHWLKGRNNLLQSIAQARILAERLKEHDPENKNLKMIAAYASLSTLPWWRRIKQIKKHHIHCQSKLRHCLMISRLLMLPRQPNG